jgi:hypothetical protein
MFCLFPVMPIRVRHAGRSGQHNADAARCGQASNTRWMRRIARCQLIWPYATIADGLKNGPSMKTRTLSIACLTAAATLMAACTAVYKNSDACEQLMRSKLADRSTDTLKVVHTGAAIHGSRVVVEGAIDHVMTASEVVAAAGPLARARGLRGASGVAAAASASSDLSVADGGAGAGVGVGASASGAASAVEAASAVASSAVAASAARAVSDATAPGGALSMVDKSGKPKKTITAAAAECTFHGSTLDVFNWLAPAKYATPEDGAGDTSSN